MSYRKPLYECRIEYKGGHITYIVRILLGCGKFSDVVVSEDVYNTIGSLTRKNRCLSLQDERYREFRELSEEELYERGVPFAPSAEDVAMNTLLIEEVRATFLELPPIQARRYLLVHALGFSYAEVAAMEGCSKHAVNHSLVLAKKNLQRILKKRLLITSSK